MPPPVFLQKKQAKIDRLYDELEKAKKAEAEMREYADKMRQVQEAEVPYDATSADLGTDEYYEHYHEKEDESYNSPSSAGVYAGQSFDTVTMDGGVERG
eukprot:4579762-Ditylum_brightwellii.AAC.1